MWTRTSVDHWDEQQWTAALESVVLSDEARSAARFIFQISSQVPETYIGGNDTPFLLQVLSAPSENRVDVDIMVSALSPVDAQGVHYCHTARGEDALRLCSSFMEAFPDAPVLLQHHDGSFDYIVCALKDQDWSKGPVTLRRLSHFIKQDADAQLAFYLPASQSPQHDRSVNFDRFPRRDALPS